MIDPYFCSLGVFMVSSTVFRLNNILVAPDLRVLGKGDFRQLIKWRLRLVKYRDELKGLEVVSDDEEREVDGTKDVTVPETEEEKEDKVQAEIRALQ